MAENEGSGPRSRLGKLIAEIIIVGNELGVDISPERKKELLEKMDLFMSAHSDSMGRVDFREMSFTLATALSFSLHMLVDPPCDGNCDECEHRDEEHPGPEKVTIQ
jgi:hypothetical protein